MIHVNLKDPKIVWGGFKMWFASHLHPRVPDVIYDYVDIDSVYYGRLRANAIIPCAICGADATGSGCFTGWGPFESICRPCYEKRERGRNNAVHTEKE